MLAGTLLERWESGRDAPPFPPEDPSLHARVELGVEGHLLARDDRPDRPPPRPVYDAASIGFLARAYAATYAAEFDPGALLKSHRSAIRLIPWLVTLTRSVRLGRPAGRALGVLARMGMAPGFSSDLAGILPPPTWLVAAADEVVDEFADRFRDRLETGLDSLENYNLDTGRPERDEGAYPIARRVSMELERRRAATASPRPAVRHDPVPSRIPQ